MENYFQYMKLIQRDFTSISRSYSKREEVAILSDLCALTIITNNLSYHDQVIVQNAKWTGSSKTNIVKEFGSVLQIKFTITY